MQGKIGLEEHFAIPETLDDSRGFFPDRILAELKERLLDLHGRRLKLMDEHGIEMMLLSLNAPAVQAIPDPCARPTRWRAAPTTILPRRCASAPTASRDWPRCRCRTRSWRRASLNAASRSSGFKGVLVNGFSQVGDPDTHRLLRPAAVPAVLGRGRAARRAVLSASAQSAANATHASTTAIPG